MGILTTLAKKKVKAAVKKKADEKIAATNAAKKKAVAANKKKAKATAEKKKTALVKKQESSPAIDMRGRFEFTGGKLVKETPEQLKARKKKIAAIKSRGKVSKKTFESELRELKSKAMTDANRQREASKLAVKYGRTIRMNGKTFGPKKGPPISRERIPGVKRNNKGEIIDREGT